MHYSINAILAQCCPFLIIRSSKNISLFSFKSSKLLESKCFNIRVLRWFCGSSELQKGEYLISFFFSICYKKKLLSWYILGVFFSQKGSLILNIPVLYSSIINNYHLQPVYINAVGVTPQFLHFHTIFFPLNLLLTSYFWQFFVPNSIWVLRGSAEIPIAELLAGVSAGVILLLMEHS